MARQSWTVWIVAGVATAVGIAIGFAIGPVMRGDQQDVPPAGFERAVARDIADVVKMPVAEAQRHREDRYERIRTIEQTLALPGDFAQTEALYVLAGRSDSGEVQDLIDQANRIADPTDREAALSILFLRLAELDPESALTMARMRAYTSSRTLEGNIWRTWSKLDLDAALTAANSLSSPADRNFAGQVMLAAFGYTGNATTDRIERELGIQPSAQARARHLVSIADRSVPEAFAAIGDMPRGERQQAMQWLASYLGQRDPTQALGYARLIGDPVLRRAYETTISDAVARQDPERILAGAQPISMQGKQAAQYFSALQTLAATDIDKALGYFDRIESPQFREAMANVITDQLAKRDPLRALEWAREQDSGGRPSIELNALNQIAAVDPDLALREVGAMTSPEYRQQALSGVLSTLSRSDPARAAAFVDGMTNPRERQLVAGSVIHGWASVDPEAAVNWILSSDIPQAESLLQQTGYAIIGRDVDLAMRLLPRLNDATARQWGSQIAATLASQRGPDDAIRFVERYRGTPAYDEMQSALISNLAQSDPARASQIVNRMAPGLARDRGIEQLISYRANQSPRDALPMLDRIENEQVRASAVGILTSRWAQQDPAAVVRWIGAEPAGAARDQAIMQIANSAAIDTADVDRLIETMSDSALRYQAFMMRVYALAQSDPAQARTYLRSIDMPEAQRRQLELQIDRFGESSGRF